MRRGGRIGSFPCAFHHGSGPVQPVAVNEFLDTPTVIEQKLFVKFLEHRMRAFQGPFHANPDTAVGYGWSERWRDLTGMRGEAGDLREWQGKAIR